MTDPAYRDLKILGTHAPLPASPEEAVLERVSNPHPGETYLVRFIAPEFTRRQTEPRVRPVTARQTPAEPFPDTTDAV